jgi:TRAP-type C4-dicarboxylate transport system permease small subunit
MLKKSLAIVKLLFGVIEKVLEVLSMGMLLAMAGIICYQVVMRFVFNDSPSWTEEVAILLMIWFGILSIPIGVKLHLHIGIEYLFNRFPPAGQYIISRMVYLIITGFGVVMIVYGLELVQFMTMSTLPATKLPSAVEYAVIPVSGVLLIFNALELLWVPYGVFVAELQQPCDATSSDR